jgi:hypothetical protein
MNKIISYKLSKKSIYKKIENVENENLEIENKSVEIENKNVKIENKNKTIVNTTSISEKKAYLQLLDKIKTSIANSNSHIKDISTSIINIYDNYDKQLLCLHKLVNNTAFDEKKYFIQALKNKLDSYKQQDKKKTYDTYDDFITLENIIDKLVAYNMKCYYCNSKTLILFKNLRDDYQWTLDRLNNYDEHSNANTIICCLKCNLQRRRKNSEKFKFTKQLEHNLLLLKKID